jgi:hypothetical protein
MCAHAVDVKMAVQTSCGKRPPLAIEYKTYDRMLLQKTQLTTLSTASALLASHRSHSFLYNNFHDTHLHRIRCFLNCLHFKDLHSDSVSTAATSSIMKLSATFSIAACSILELASAAPFSSDTSNRSLNPRATYTMFGGDGSAANGWPSRQQWMPYETALSVIPSPYLHSDLILIRLRNANLATIRQSCGTLGWGPNNSDAEIQALKDAITKVSASSGIPKVLSLPLPPFLPN